MIPYKIFTVDNSSLLPLESHTIPERFSKTLIPPDMKQAYALDLVLFLSIN